MNRINSRAWPLFFALGLGSGCDDSECKALDTEMKGRTDVLERVARAAGVSDKVRMQADQAEEAAKKVMEAMGLDKDERVVAAALEARVRAIPTATIARGTVQVSSEGPGGESVPESVTQWIVSFEERDPQQALTHLNELLKVPPLVRFSLIARPQKTSGSWHVELRRANVLQVPIQPTAINYPRGLSLETIPSKIALCGAGDKRKAIESTNAEIEKLRREAEATSVHLPRAASYEGLRRRTGRLRDFELESRKQLALFEAAILANKLPLKAMSADEGSTAVEFWGSDKDRARVEKWLIEKGMGDRLAARKPGAGGVERIVATHPMAQAGTQGAPSGEGH